MFVLFINDMPEVVTGCIEMFANDAKIFKEMSTEQDRSELQEDLDNPQPWASTWKTKFNAAWSALHVERRMRFRHCVVLETDASAEHLVSINKTLVHHGVI